MWPAGVVADHPAERAPAVGGRVRAEAQAVRGGRGLQRVEHHSRLHPGQPGRRVDFEHRVEVAGEVEDHTGADGVTRYRRTGASDGERYTLLAAEGDDGGHIIDASGQHHRLRWHPVVRRIGGVQRAGPGVGSRLTTHRGPQRTAEHVVIHRTQHGATQRGARAPQRRSPRTGS